MTDFQSRLETYFERVERKIPTHRDDIGTLVERKNKYKLYYSRTYHGVGKFASTLHCIENSTKVDLLITLLEDNCIDIIEFRMRINNTMVLSDGLAFINPAFENGLESRRRVVRRKSSVKQRLQAKHAEKYS